MKHVAERKFQVSETIKAIEGIDLYKTEKWWCAIVLMESLEKNRSECKCGIRKLINGKEGGNSSFTTKMNGLA